MSLKPVCGIPQESSPAPFSAPALWGSRGTEESGATGPFLRGGRGTGYGLQTNEHPHSASPLPRLESAAALPTKEQGPSSCLPATGTHSGPSLRLPPASWGQSTHGREKPNTRAYHLPSTPRSAHFCCVSWGQSVSPSGLQCPTLSEE